MLANIVAILVMILGFGFVIFWHELGHFLGARWAKMRVEQFAVGMGHALISYRKGIGVKLGSTAAEFDARVMKEFNDREIREKERRDSEGKLYEIGHTPSLREKYDIAKDLGIGETEYRLAWIPIGGYVKPTGQDDLRPAAVAAKDDPGSYAAAPVGKRMVMISAGVVMNVILAAILFFVLFYFVGFRAPRPIVSGVQSNSPAAEAGVIGGDELVSLNGHALQDFNKTRMWTALMPDDEKVELKIRRDGELKTLHVQPRPTRVNANMLALGISPAYLLKGAPADRIDQKEVEKLSPDQRAVMPGEKIVAVNGQPIGVEDFAAFDRIIQSSSGAPIALTIENEKEQRREQSVRPVFATGFNGGAFTLAGMRPRTRIASIGEGSCAKGKLEKGDIIFSLRDESADIVVYHPAIELFARLVTDAGRREAPVQLTVMRGDETLVLEPIVPTNKLANKQRGLNVGLDADVDHAVVAATSVPKADEQPSPDAIPPGATLAAIDGNPVSTWMDVHRVLGNYTKPSGVFFMAMTAQGEKTVKIDLNDNEVLNVRTIRYENPIHTLDMAMMVRETDNPLTAVAWGVGETRDLILQTYITLRRVFGGSVPASNLSGPVGIFKAGRLFALQGTDSFIWFLALVSANLAVVNFLPVPILDGWHFLSLLKEKLTGKPVNERVQEYASWLGLALILSLLIFVTFNDLTR